MPRPEISPALLNRGRHWVNMKMSMVTRNLGMYYIQKFRLTECLFQGTQLATAPWCQASVGNKSLACLVAQSRPTLCNPMNCRPPDSSIHGDSPGKNTGVGCHALLQGIFPAQGLNLGLPHCRSILYQLSHQGICLLRVVFLQVWFRGLLQNYLECLLKIGGLILDLLSLHL